MRLFDVAIVSLAVAGAAYVFDVKHQAEQLRDTRSELARGVGALSQDVALLEADLAALENPQRLQGLVGQLDGTMQLGAVSSGHYIALGDIPFRQVDVLATEADAADAGEITGSVPATEDGAQSPTQADTQIGDLLSALADGDQAPLPDPLSPNLDAEPETLSTIDQLLERLP